VVRRCHSERSDGCVECRSIGFCTTFWKDSIWWL
jgi:hypothetical protein